MIRVNGRARAPQYWKMDRQIYARGEPPFYTKLTPEFCFGHWSTQCRSAFQVALSQRPSLSVVVGSTCFCAGVCVYVPYCCSWS